MRDYRSNGFFNFFHSVAWQKKYWFTVLLLLTLLLLSFETTSAEVYKWVDANGKVHFSDKKPEKTKAEEVDLTINTYKHVSFDMSVFEKESDPEKEKSRKVVMYSTQWCGYCKKARKYFKANNIAFTEYDIEKDEKDEKARIRHKKMGAKGVPVILVGSKRMNGFSQNGFERIYQ